jgi:hypothetical protein
MHRLIVLPALMFALAFAGMVRASDEQTVIVPVGEKPCKITDKDMVRVQAKGIAGSRIEVTVDGDAEVVTKRTIIERAGGKDVIGNTVEEYDIEPTGKGKAKIKVTVTPPNGRPAVTHYVLEIK